MTGDYSAGWQRHSDYTALDTRVTSFNVQKSKGRLLKTLSFQLFPKTYNILLQQVYLCLPVVFIGTFCWTSQLGLLTPKPEPAGHDGMEIKGRERKV